MEMQCIPLPEQPLAYSQTRIAAIRLEHLQQMRMVRQENSLILCLSDKDLNELIRIKEKDEQPTAEFFEAMLDDILIHLEK